MKIEIGESLIYSWLRHCYNCQICQTNWKTSQKWNVDEDDWSECQILMDESSTIFGNVFKQTKNIKQLMKQCEIDVLGINTFNSSVFAVDIAYHSGGLGYKNSIDVVTKKILRTVFALKLYFPKIGAYNIYFISPIVNKKLNDILHIRVEEIISFLQKNDINFNVELLSNDKFKIDILSPIMKISNEIADMSELFLRSHQLISLFENQNEIKSTLITKSKKDNESDGELAIGAFAQIQFKLLMLNDMLNKDILDKLQNLEYCRSVLGMNFPILRKLNDKMSIKEERKINGYDRYYAKPINNYLLCNDWYEKHRDALNKWFLNLNKQPNRVK
jgi:hypothetical protein